MIGNPPIPDKNFESTTSNQMNDKFELGDLIKVALNCNMLGKQFKALTNDAGMIVDVRLALGSENTFRDFKVFYVLINDAIRGPFFANELEHLKN